MQKDREDQTGGQRPRSSCRPKAGGALEAQQLATEKHPGPGVQMALGDGPVPARSGRRVVLQPPRESPLATGPQGELYRGRGPPCTDQKGNDSQGVRAMERTAWASGDETVREDTCGWAESAPTTRQQEEAFWTGDTSVDVLSLSPGHPAPISTGPRQSGHRAGTGVTPGANHMDPPTQATTGGPPCQKQSPEPAPSRPPRGPTSPSPSKALSCPQRTCRWGLWALPALPSMPLPGPLFEPQDQCCIQPGHSPQLPPALPWPYPEAAGLWEGLVALRRGRGWGGR